jgi:hypothetical protein
MSYLGAIAAKSITPISMYGLTMRFRHQRCKFHSKDWGSGLSPSLYVNS